MYRLLSRRLECQENTCGSDERDHVSVCTTYVARTTFNTRYIYYIYIYLYLWKASPPSCSIFLIVLTCLTAMSLPIFLIARHPFAVIVPRVYASNTIVSSAQTWWWLLCVKDKRVGGFQIFCNFLQLRLLQKTQWASMIRYVPLLRSWCFAFLPEFRAIGLPNIIHGIRVPICRDGWV